MFSGKGRERQVFIQVDLEQEINELLVLHKEEIRRVMWGVVRNHYSTGLKCQNLTGYGYIYLPFSFNFTYKVNNP